MSWLYLALAIGFEIVGTTAMKMSQGLTRLGPALVLFVSYVISFTFLALALKRLDVGVAYAIWSGVGTAIIAVIGWLVFNEMMTPLKVVSIGLIIAGVVGLQWGGGHP